MLDSVNGGAPVNASSGAVVCDALPGERSGESIWNPVVWPARLSFFVGFILFALQILAEVLKSLRQLFHKEHEA